MIQRSIEEAPCALKRSWLYNVPRREVLSATGEDDYDDEYPNYEAEVAECRAKIQRRSLDPDHCYLDQK